MKQFGIVCLTLLVMAVAADPTNWSSFKRKYGKKYKNAADESAHMKVFMENLKKVTEHNKLFKDGKVPNKIGINEFSDMTDEEFYSTRTGDIPAISDFEEEGERIDIPYDAKVPDSIDWRTKGAVTHVKNQGFCGSCWSFGVLGAVEGQHFLKTGKLVSLSEQNLLDCVNKTATACYGGNPFMAYNYIMQNGGVESEATYPYTAKKGVCKFNPKNVAVTVRDYVLLPRNETALTYAIATVGPITVSINSIGLKDHSAGTYYQSACNTTTDHSVLIVGYGSDKNGDYYTIKNSWGPNWGNNGYFRMARNQNGNCGIITRASYPIL